MGIALPDRHLCGLQEPPLVFWTQGGLRDHGPDTLKWATSPSWATCASTLYRRRLHAQGYLCGDFKKHFWSSAVCLVPCTVHIITERVRKACFHGRVRRWTHGASARLIHGLIHGASARHL